MPKEKQRIPRKAAVALGYDMEKDAAPTVLAAGHGEVAEQILRVAQEHQIPVRHDSPLADALSRLQIGGTIPPELFGAVAEVLAFLWSVEQEERHDLRDWT